MKPMERSVKEQPDYSMFSEIHKNCSDQFSRIDQVVEKMHATRLEKERESG